MIKLGDINAQKVMLGTTPVQRVMLGTQQVWALTPPYLNVTPTSQSLPNTAGSFTIQIESNIAWTVENSNSWLSVSAVSGIGNATITVTYSANTANLRIANIVIKAGVITKMVGVTQATGIVSTLYVTPSQLDFPKSASSNSFTISSSDNWTRGRITGGWVSVDKTSGSPGNTNVEVSVRAYTISGPGRSTTLTITNSDGVSATVKVTQGFLAEYMTAEDGDNTTTMAEVEPTTEEPSTNQNPTCNTDAEINNTENLTK